MAKKKKSSGNSKILSQLKRDLKSSEGLAKQYLDLTPLPQLDASRPTETSNLLNLRLAYADPNNASFAGRNSADINDIIARFKSGLEGYTSAENQGFREAAQRGIDTSYQTSLRGLQANQGRNLVRGAAAGAQQSNLERARLREQQELEQDLFLKNADEKQKRLSTYGDFVTGAEDTSFKRGQQAIQSYQDLLGTTQTNERGINEFNIGQLEKDRAAKSAGTLGFAGLINQRLNEKRQNEILGKNT